MTEPLSIHLFDEATRITAGRAGPAPTTGPSSARSAASLQRPCCARWSSIRKFGAIRSQ